MSSRQVGNRRENRISAILEQIGYTCFPSRGSRGIDVVAVAPHNTTLPHIGAEIGGSSKRLRLAFEKLWAAPRVAGMVLLVAQEILRDRRRSVRWYASPDGKRGGHENVLDAIEEARSL